MRRLLVVMSSLVITAALARADEAPPPTPPPASIVQLGLDKTQSTMTYHLIHKMHKVDGKSKALDGRARLIPTGAQVMIRVPVESFDSENVNRDAHMKEAVEAEKYPLVEVRALVDGFTMPTTFPTTVEKTVKASIIFHGITQTIDVPVKIVVEAANKIRATATFGLSLDAFKVERPSLMFVKVEDELKLDANLVFTK